MKQDKFGQLVFSESDVCDLIMQGHDPMSLKNLIVEPSVSLKNVEKILDNLPDWNPYQEYSGSVEQFHARNQARWHMPEQYKNMDIAQYVLNLCDNEAELQRCGHELLLFQEKGLFDLLKYLTYLVDIMKQNNIIWGVGRGSSVSSFVLYKLGVHRINSMYYDLSPEEFLR